MRARYRLLWSLAVWLFPAALTADLVSCNDGSTGCCMVCPECACGDMCMPCAIKCTSPKGCYCGSNTGLKSAALRVPPVELMSRAPDAGARE